MTIDIKQGKGGKYRWHLVIGNGHRGMSSIQGYDTKADAIEAARSDFGDEVFLDDRRRSCNVRSGRGRSGNGESYAHDYALVPGEAVSGSEKFRCKVAGE